MKYTALDCPRSRTLTSIREPSLVSATAALTKTAVCCTDQRCGRAEPYPRSGSCDTDTLRPPELKHTVQHTGGDGRSEPPFQQSAYAEDPPPFMWHDGIIA